jgi:catechol 2,3-dioxygenase-like lactoylglutathione lyase family enzyme
MIVTGVDFVSIPTRDMKAARAFYTDVLGIEPSNLWARGEEDPLGAEFEPGDVTIALSDVETIGIPFAPHNVPIALQVEDVAAARAELEGRGVVFKDEDIIDSGVCHQTFFADPDGNMIGLHHRYAPRG